MSKHISEHVFLYPFQWYNKEAKNKSFSEQINLNGLHFDGNGKWNHVIADDYDPITYNEKNYFYPFVHSAIYDNGRKDTNVCHFERKEPKIQPVKYIITLNTKEFELKVEKITIDFYSTGIGIMSFFLSNDVYNSKDDILLINQYGRRLFPPFAMDVVLRSETAKRISVQGLNGVYEENFEGYADNLNGTIEKMKRKSNSVAPFVIKMIEEVVREVETAPVVDDRMFVLSYFRDDVISKQCENAGLLTDDFWYKFVFVDGSDVTCQNEEMREQLIKQASYMRWQGWGSLYGSSRYSLLMATSTSMYIDHLAVTFVTIYARMVMLLLAQRASVLRFSHEVSVLSRMHRGKELTDKVSSLYKEYIRFVNQIHFREVSAQEQGIEMYQILYDQFQLKEQVEKLDNEIEEIYNYVLLCEDRKSNSTMSILTWLAAILGTLSMVFAFWGMNNNWLSPDNSSYWQMKCLYQLLTAIAALPIVWVILKLVKRFKIKK